MGVALVDSASCDKMEECLPARLAAAVDEGGVRGGVGQQLAALHLVRDIPLHNP